MGDVDVTIYYNEDRLNAMERILHEQGTNLTTAITEQMDALYVQLVPEQERSEIDAKIAQEHAQRMEEQEAARRFAVVHLHDDQEDYHFITELHTSFLQSARLYRLVTKDLTGPNTPLQRMKIAHMQNQAIAPEVFAQYCEDMPNDHRITALVEYDFESGMVSVCESSDNHWLTYKLKDVSTAVFRADRKSDMRIPEREHVFQEALYGKEIEFEDQDLSENPGGPAMTM